MNSWIMRRWLETHKKGEYPDLSITQENDAFHVLPESRHPSEESIMRMCSPDFFSQHKYKYVERSIEEFGNPPTSPPYEEPVLDHSKDCVAKVATSNEDLGYACPLNERMRSLGTENDTLNLLYKETTTLSGTENQNLDYAQQNANMNETYDYAEVTEIRHHSWMGHNKNGAHIAAVGFEDNTNTNTQHKYKYVERPIDFGLEESFEEYGSPPSSPPYDEPEGYEEVIYDSVYDSSSDPEHNENAVFEELHKQVKKAVKNADSVNTKYSSLTTHYKTGIPKEKGHRLPIEHRPNQADMTEKDETQSCKSRKTKLQEEPEGYEEVIYDSVYDSSSDPEHNENVVSEELRKQEQKAEKNANSGNTKYRSLTMYYEEPTGVPKETENHCHIEHKKYQAGVTERDETQGTPPKKKTKLQPGHENNEGDNGVCVPMNPEDEKRIYGPITLSVDPNENAISEEVSDFIPMNPEDEGKNASPGEICNQKTQSVSQEETVRMTCSKEDDSTEKTTEDDHGAQSLLPTGEGTECEVPHQPSPFRRIRTIWRKQKTTETNKQAIQKAKNMENKENALPGCGSEKEIVREQVP